MMVENACASAIELVAPSGIYADLAEQLGGNHLSIVVAERESEAQSRIHPGSIVLCSGAPKDDWLRDAARRISPPATVIAIPVMRPGNNDDIPVPWYDVKSIATFTHMLADELMRRDPSMAPNIAGNLANADRAFQAVRQTIEEIARTYAHSDVIAADGLSRAVARQVGFKAVPRAGELAKPASVAIAEAIQRQEGSIFLYDRDRPGSAMKKLADMANDTGIPAAGLQEKLPRGLHYQQWALRQWNTIRGALNQASQ